MEGDVTPWLDGPLEVAAENCDRPFRHRLAFLPVVDDLRSESPLESHEPAWVCVPTALRHPTDPPNEFAPRIDSTGLLPHSVHKLLALAGGMLRWLERNCPG
jgi:hypothetical protein